MFATCIIHAKIVFSDAPFNSVHNKSYTIKLEWFQCPQVTAIFLLYTCTSLKIHNYTPTCMELKIFFFKAFNNKLYSKTYLEKQSGE